MLSADRTYRKALAELPEELRRSAGELPFRLGLCERPDGGWDDFVKLEPNRNLPLFAAEAVPAAAPETLAAHCEAHHLGGIFGLLVDRVADRQAGATPELARLARWLLRAWRSALARATGDAAVASASIAEARSQWREGVRLSRAALSQGGMDLAGYARASRAKLRFVGTATRALLRCSGDPARARSWPLVADLFLVGQQGLDDALDAPDDSRRNGRSMPDLLGVTPAALYRAAVSLIERAGEAAGHEGFRRLASWVSCFTPLIDRWSPLGRAPADDWQGIVIAGAVEAELARAPEEPA